MIDLTRTPGCKAVGPQLETLITNIEKYNLDQLKQELIRILDDPTTSISREKNEEYKKYAHRILRLDMMREYIVNLYMASARLSVQRSKRRY